MFKMLLYKIKKQRIRYLKIYIIPFSFVLFTCFIRCSMKLKLYPSG